MKYERLSKKLISPFTTRFCRHLSSSTYQLCNSKSGGDQIVKNSAFFFHFNDPPFNLNTLVNRVQKSGLLDQPVTSNGTPTNELLEPSLIDAVHSCKELSRLLSSVKGTSGSHTSDIHRLKQALRNSRKFKTPLHLLESIMEANKPGMSISVARTYLSEAPFPETAQAISVLEPSAVENGVKTWQSATTVSDYNSLVFIALRRALLRKEVKYAYELAALAKPSAITCSNKHTILSNVAFSVMSTGAVLSVSQVFHIPIAVSAMLMMCMGLLQYTRLLKQLGTRTRVRLRRLSSAVSSSPSIWAQQVWFDMVNRIAIGYDELIDLNVDNFHQLADEHHKQQQEELKRENSDHNLATNLDSSLEKESREVQQRELVKAKLTLNETGQERMFNEYWTSAGVGFEWVEPDQDPSDEIVRRIRQKDRF